MKPTESAISSATTSGRHHTVLDRNQYHILLGVTGSVAAIKAPELAVRLMEIFQEQSTTSKQQYCSNNNKNSKVCLKLLLTRGGENFWSKARMYNEVYWNQMESYKESGDVQVISADEEWRDWKVLGDPVLHIDLRNWADMLLIAPLSAHSLAKMANGFCDDTLSCVVRAWTPHKPILLAPAMNTAMWEHVLTTSHLETVQSFGNVRIVPPQSKLLACGEVGVGAMASVEEIAEMVKESLAKI